MTWLVYPKGLLELGPPPKQGYAAYPSPQNKEGFVLHSMVGSYPSALGRLLSPDRASWHFSVLKNGHVYQHYDPRAVTWHAGVVGDADSLSAAVGNVALIGIEHEGGAPGNVSEPLTPAQLDATIDLQRWCYLVLPELKPPALRSSHFEHGWISATACPSGRIPWDTIMTRLQEDSMVQLKLVRKDGTPEVYLACGGILVHVPSEEALTANGWSQADVEVLPAADAIWNLPRFGK